VIVSEKLKMSDNLNGCPTNSNGKRSAGGESPIDDQDAEYIVEKIVGKSFLDGRPQVLVKWQGYPIEQSTWEPRHALFLCTPPKFNNNKNKRWLLFNSTAGLSLQMDLDTCDTPFGLF